MTRTVRRTLILLAGTLGIAVATTSPAMAALNHSEPLIRVARTR